MQVTVEFGKYRDVTPGDLDGVKIMFLFQVIRPGKGALRNQISEHRITIGISGTLYAIWDFGSPFEGKYPSDAIKTLYAFAKRVVEEKLKSQSLEDVEEHLLYTNEFPDGNPFDPQKIENPEGAKFTVNVGYSNDQTSRDADIDPNAPKVFMSYSWDGDEHRDWVRELASRLRGDGVNMTLDQWHTAPGDPLPEFMERSVRENDLVLIVCTPRYKEKSDARKGGVGYEGYIMTAEVLTKGNHRKFIPILRSGEWSQSAPSWVEAKFYLDFRGDPYAEKHYNDLLATIHNKRPVAPPIGPAPQIEKATKESSRTTAVPKTGPIKIEGVIADEVTMPRNDGTRGSGLYAIPFRLSRQPSSDWEDAFIRTWNRPPRFTGMHRPKIARVSGDKIILDGTTIEEVERYHRDTLQISVEEANKAIEKLQAEKERRRREEEDRKQQHNDNVNNIANRLRFD